MSIVNGSWNFGRIAEYISRHLEAIDPEKDRYTERRVDFPKVVAPHFQSNMSRSASCPTSLALEALGFFPLPAEKKY